MSDQDFAHQLEQDYQSGTERSMQFQELDEYYILWAGSYFGHTAHMVNFNFDRFFKYDPKFRGFLCNTPTEDTLGRLGVLRVISPLEFARRRRKGAKIGLVSLCSSSLELRIFESLKKDTFSFICAMHGANANHTYVSMESERRFIMDNLARYADIISKFEDETSRRMLTARLRSILALNLDHIIRNHYDVGLSYFNAYSAEYSFLLKESEIFVDVGASWGDGAIKFCGMIRDLDASRIFAFEPNEGEFKKLRGWEHFFPLKADSALVSNRTGEAYLSTYGQHAHGSRIAATGSAGAERRTVKLDDVCEKATLIKIDAEGAEPDILEGARRLLSDPDCRLASCIYHYPGDLFKTIDILEGVGRKRLFFRQHYASLWDGLVYFH